MERSKLVRLVETYLTDIKDGRLSDEYHSLATEYLRENFGFWKDEIACGNCKSRIKSALESNVDIEDIVEHYSDIHEELLMTINMLLMDKEPNNYQNPVKGEKLEDVVDILYDMRKLKNYLEQNR